MSINSKLAGIGFPRPFLGADDASGADDFPLLFSLLFAADVEEVSDFLEFVLPAADVFVDDLLGEILDWSANALSMDVIAGRD